MNASLGHLFLQGGWVMWPLLILSIVTWAVVIERAYVYIAIRPRLMRLSQSVLQSLKSGDNQTARQICSLEKAQLSEIFLGAMDTKRPRESVERVTERNRVRLMAYMKRNLWVLGTVGSASPFIGLLGTVVGIVRAFHDMSEKGAGGFSVVAGGISEALVATAAGLVVAIVALITYNVYVTLANQTLTKIKLSLEELLDQSFGQSFGQSFEPTKA